MIAAMVAESERTAGALRGPEKLYDNATQNIDISALRLLLADKGEVYHDKAKIEAYKAESEAYKAKRPLQWSMLLYKK